MKLLDLCCGLGGWSKGFAAEGFECYGIDIINPGYPYNFINCDMRNVSSKDYKNIDVITASPPCRDFSKMCRVAKVRNWKIQPDPEGKGIELVNHCLRIIKEINPKYWILENVPGILKYISIKPRCQVYLTKTMKRVFFGNYPEFLISKTKRKNISEIQGKLRSWKRAEIPFLVSNFLAKAILKET